MTSNPQQTPTYECAIIGGGVSGLYAGWRLLTDAQAQYGTGEVAVFEMSNRTGGRLLSWLPFKKEAGLRAELGGMRILEAEQGADGKLLGHQLTYNLTKKEFKLATEPFYTYDNDDPAQDKAVMLLRGELMRYRDPNLCEIGLRYKLARAPFDEKQVPAALLELVLDEIMLANGIEDREWKSWDRQTWDRKKPDLLFENQPLYKWGFWNLLSTILTYEGYHYLVDSLGYYSLVRNWNAAEAVSFIAQDFAAPPNFVTLQEGMGHLPEMLHQKFVAAGGVVHLNHQLTKFEFADNGEFLLSFHNTAPLDPGFDGTFYQTVKAKKLILALPHWSLKQLDASEAFNLRQDRALRRKINTVIGVPAFKLFMLYKERWWEQPKTGGSLGGDIKRGHSVCDLPIRQTYYFKPDEDASDETYKGYGLLMVSYGDGPAVDYWKGMEEKPIEDGQDGVTFMAELEKLHLAPLFSGRPENGQKRAGSRVTSSMEEQYKLPPNVHKAPPAMVERALEQVALLHGRLPGDPKLRPEICCYADWSLDPFGGGWNFWRPQVNALEIMEHLATHSICEPHNGQMYHAYIVGEAYCGLQGWIEGTLTMTEVVLRNNFGLARPQWLPAEYYLGPGSDQRAPLTAEKTQRNLPAGAPSD